MNIATHLKEVQLSSSRIRELFHLYKYDVHETIDILSYNEVSFIDYFDDILLASKLHKDGFRILSKVFSVSEDWLTGKSDQVRKQSSIGKDGIDVIRKVRKLNDENRLSCFCPFCSSDALDGQLIDHSGENLPDIKVGIILFMVPENEFKHRTIEVYGPISFSKFETRSWFKTAMMAAYNICAPGTFKGRHFKLDVMKDIFLGSNPLRAEDLETDDEWNAECYLGETVGNDGPIEEWEVDDVRRRFNAISRNLSRESGP